MGIIGILKTQGYNLICCVFSCVLSVGSMILPLNESKPRMTKVGKLLQLSLNLNSGTVGTPNIELNAIMKKCFQPERCL